MDRCAAARWIHCAHGEIILETSVLPFVPSSHVRESVNLDNPAGPLLEEATFLKLPNVR